tara:strand:- start:258 stop:671 length:414 start_codon:yes stop_codon:yes gene_type:complete
MKKTTTKATTKNFSLTTNKGRGTIDKVQAELAGKMVKRLHRTAAFSNIDVTITGKWIRINVTQKELNKMTAVNRKRFMSIINNKNYHLHTLNGKGQNVTYDWKYVASSGYFKCGPRIGFTPAVNSGGRYRGSSFRVR